jgi:hypothetical protein
MVHADCIRVIGGAVDGGFWRSSALSGIVWRNTPFRARGAVFYYLAFICIKDERKLCFVSYFDICKDTSHIPVTQAWIFFIVEAD